MKQPKNMHEKIIAMETPKDIRDVRYLWIEQLYREHHDISWFYRAKLRPVVIQLSDTQGFWGKWDPLLRTITLSIRLIENHSWDVVVEILKHEMAHQYVSEHLSDMDGTDHGEPFKKACKRLGVASWAARAAGDLPGEQIPCIRQRVVSSEDQRLLDRVEKLLSLSQSTNEHEAFLAMQKSREICAKHNLDKHLRQKNEDSLDSLFLCRKKRKTDPIDAKILSIMNEHFSVRVIHTSIFDAVACTKFQAAELLGRRENILMAEYVYHFLRQQCDSLWSSYKKSTKVHGSRRRSYQLGVLSGFDDKLVSAGSIDKKIIQDAGRKMQDVIALQKVERSSLEDYVEVRYPRLSKKSWGSGRLDQGAFQKGQVEGRRLNLNRPLESRGGFGGFLK